MVRIEAPVFPGWRIGVTRPGALYLGALAGVWAAAFYSGNNLLYLCGAMLFALAAAALVRGVRLLRQTPELGPALPEYVEAGRREALQGGVIPLTDDAALLDVKWHSADSMLTGRLRLAGRGTLTGNFFSESRGCVSLSRQELSTSFPLGLWRIIRFRQQQGKLFAMPRPVPWHDAQDELRRLEQGDEWQGLREYVSGDALSRVHWRKVTSVDASWTVKRFDRSQPHDQLQLLRVDLRLPSGADEKRFEELLGKAWFWFQEQLPRLKDGDLLVLGQASFNLGDYQARRAAIEALACAQPDLAAPIGSGGILLSLMGSE
ncbi:MAG: DUF58 domain-containing protein [Mariprofundaceae bacterium]|nr:DUF58 domain-containing protein [Mariprofundaceae bacterium]